MTTNPNCHLKSDSHCFKLYVTCHLSFVTLIWQMLAKFWGVEPERTASKFTGLFTHSIKLSREMRKIHVAVVQQWLRNVQKSVMHVRSCFANINLLLFCSFRCRRRSLRTADAFPVERRPEMRLLFAGYRRRCRCQSSLLLLSRNSGTMVTWRHTSPLYWTFFCPSPVTAPDVFAKAYSTQFPSRFIALSSLSPFFSCSTQSSFSQPHFGLSKGGVVRPPAQITLTSGDFEICHSKFNDDPCY